jgi:Methyltransferase domain
LLCSSISRVGYGRAGATRPRLVASQSAFVLANVAWLLVCAFILLRLRRERAERKRRTYTNGGAIRTVSIDEFDPAFRTGPFGPGLATEVSFVGRGSLIVVGGTSDFEAWILATLSRRARLMFEFGTCTGKTTYLWARNSPEGAEVITVTLGPDDAATLYREESGDDQRDSQYAVQESTFTEFLYSGTSVESKVRQLFADSKVIDVTPWAGRCDLVFVDGSHAYSYVAADSDKALQLVKPGGVVLWHDYAGPHQSPGVLRALDELARRIPLVHIAQTSLVAYRRAP